MTDEPRVAVITGAAGGLGAAFARQLALDGMAVAVVDIQDGTETIEGIHAAGGDADCFECDLTDPRQVDQLAEDINDRFGRADVLINAAGRYDRCRFADMTYEFWRSVMAANLDSMFLTCKAFAPGMRERGWGRIVNVTASSALLDRTMLAQAIASRSGAMGLANALSSEFGPDGVTVNTIALGPVTTNAHSVTENPAARQFTRPEDATGLVSFLASDAAATVTGQTIACDGAWARVQTA